MPCLKTNTLRTLLIAGLIAAGTSQGQTRPAAVVPLPALPTDLNLASLRANALATLYEFDLSPEQLKALRGAAAKTATSRKRTAVKANPALTLAFKDFQAALLGGKDDETIAKARNNVVEVAADRNDLDDAVEASDAALAAAPAMCGELKASQIARISGGACGSGGRSGGDDSGFAGIDPRDAHGRNGGENCGGGG